MERYLFIINPIAGRGKAKNALDRINEKMRSLKKEYKIFKTSKPREAEKLVLENIDEYDIFIAVGGDGTINEVATGIAKAGKGVLGILPLGTANDLARALDLSTDIDKALDNLLSGKRSKIDVGIANGSHFFNIASIGYDAEVIVNYNNFKKKRGVINYYISVIYTLIKYRNKRVKLKIDDKEIDGDMFLLAAGNGKYYGGGFQILPDSKIGDGNMYVCTIKGVNKLIVLLLLPTLINGRHIKIKKYVDIHKSKEIKIISKEALALNLDGEILGEFEKINFKYNGQQIDIIC